MSDTPLAEESADPLPSLDAIIHHVTTADRERQKREDAVVVWRAMVGPDIDTFEQAVRSMRELEGSALQPEFDGQPWAPHLMTAGRLIRARGWHDIVRQDALTSPSRSEKAFARLLLDIADRELDEPAVRQQLAKIREAKLVAAMSWQHPLDRWMAGINGRFNTELIARCSPADPPVLQSHGRKPRKKMSQPETDVAVQRWLESHAAEAKEDPRKITRDRIACDIGAHAPYVSNSPAWKAFVEKRESTRKAAERAVPLTRQMLAVLPSQGDLPAGIEELVQESLAEELEQDRRHARRSVNRNCE